MNTFCNYVKMEPIRDKLAQRTQPLAFGQSNQGRRMNDEYSSIDFPDRNLTLKKEYIKVVATEESLDNWHAQSLGVSQERFQKSKKYLQQIKKQGSNSVSVANDKTKLESKPTKIT